MQNAAERNVVVEGGNFNGAVFGGNVVQNFHFHGDVIVAPQEGQAIHGESAKLTDTLFVDVSNQISRSAHVYPGIQSKGELCCPVLTAVKIVQYKKNRLREVKNLEALTPHPNVVNLIHGGILPGNSILKQIYIVMEQCQPLTLEQYIANRKNSIVPFNTKQALDFARQIISGMKHMHSKGIVHRDLKPSSVLFSLDGKSLKIIDFGVSKDLEKGLTASGVSTEIGTDGYRAPETYRDKANENMRMPADVFSLGILICHIWSHGLHPFGEDGTLWAHNIKEGFPANLSNLLIPEPRDPKFLLKQMLKFDENARYTMEDVENHLYISQGVESALLSDMDKVWSGFIEVFGNTDCQSFNCKLYERIDQNILGLREHSAQFQILYVPLLQMTDALEGVVNVPPNGYLEVSKDVYLEQMKRKFGDKMGWIKSNNRTGVFIIFQPKGCEEVIGIFIENPQDFVNQLRTASPSERTVPKAPIGPPEHEQEAEVEEYKADASSIPPTSDEIEASNDFQQNRTDQNEGQFLTAAETEIKGRTEVQNQSQPSSSSLEGSIVEPSIPTQPSARTEIEIEIKNPEHISWWLYRSINPSERASS